MNHATRIHPPHVKHRRHIVMLALLGLILAVLFVLDLLLGSTYIPPGQVLSLLLGLESEPAVWSKILHEIRLPRALAAMLAGAALAVSGLQMQTLFRNPLAGPSVLGITAGASLGVALVMLSTGGGSLLAIRSLGLSSSWGLVIAASLGAGLVSLLILGLSLRIRDYVVLLIVGLMVGYLTLSIVSIWQYFSAPEQIQEYLLWTFGNLGGVTTSQLPVFGLAIGLGLLGAIFGVKALNLLLLGEAYARSLGLRMRRVRLLVIATTSILAGTVTGFCGPIGFIGLAVPHLTRGLLREADHRWLLPGTCLAGAALMLLCDLIAQWPGSATTLPINAITALIGAPVVIAVIMRQRNLKSTF